MSEFRILAEQITSALVSRVMEQNEVGSIESGRGAIRVEDLVRVLEECLGVGSQEINMYPGSPSNKCHGLAVFIALESPVFVKGRRGHLSCKMAIEEIVRHMDADCNGKTRQALFIADHWDTVAAEKWKSFLLRIKQQSHLEIFMIDRLSDTLLTVL